MIYKSFELSKTKLNNHKFYLFYGENEGLKDENIKNLFEKNYQDKIQRYEEKEILDNIENFFNGVLTKSFFDNKKLIIINRATVKIRTTIEDLMEKNPQEMEKNAQDMENSPFFHQQQTVGFPMTSQMVTQMMTQQDVCPTLR